MFILLVVLFISSLAYYFGLFRGMAHVIVDAFHAQKSRYGIGDTVGIVLVAAMLVVAFSFQFIGHGNWTENLCLLIMILSLIYQKRRSKRDQQLGIKRSAWDRPLQVLTYVVIAITLIDFIRR